MYYVNGKSVEFDEVKTYLVSKGFTHKKGKQQCVVEVHHFRREHCKIVVTKREGGGGARLQIQSERGGWKTKAWDRDITRLYGMADAAQPVKVKRTKPIVKANLPDPDLFSEEYYQVSKNNPSRVYNISQIRSAIVIGVVAIEDDGSIGEQGVFDFKNDAWFLTHCFTINGKVQIITDGEKWYLVGENSKGNKLRLKNNTNNLEFNKVDREILQEAIRQHVLKKSDD